MSQVNESGLSGVKMRSMNLNALEFVSVEDVIKAFEEHPYQKVMASLHMIAQPDFKPVKFGEYSRFVIWSSPASHEVLKKICQPSKDGVSSSKLPDAVVLDMILSALLQQYYTGSVDFLNKGEVLSSGRASVMPRTVQIDLEAMAHSLYPGAYTQVRWDSRMRWMQNVKKHAGSLISKGFLLSSSPKEGETGRVLKVEVSPQIYTPLATSIENSAVYVSYVPCTAFRFGRGAYRQAPSLYTAYRLLYTCLGLAYGNVSAGVGRELSFADFYGATGLPTYAEWCLQQNEFNAGPVKYCESAISNLFRQLGTLMSVQVLYQQQKVLVVPKVDVCADQIA